MRAVRWDGIGLPGHVNAVAGKKDGMKQGAIGGILKELGYTEDQVYKFYKANGQRQAPPSIANFELTSEAMVIPYRGEKFEYTGGKSYRFMPCPA